MPVYNATTNVDEERRKLSTLTIM